MFPMFPSAPWRLVAALGSLALFVLAAPVDASPITLTVDSAADEEDSNPGDGECKTSGGGCSLRAAIQETNMLDGANTIQVPAGTYQLSIPIGQGADDASGDLDIEDNTVVSGAGSGTTIIDGGGLDSVFQAVGGLEVTITGMTIRNGSTQFSGGGINSGADLTLDDVTVAGNTAGIDGGGIAAGGGSLSVTNSTISGNTATRDGGGISSARDAVLSVANSTIDGNSGRIGGGIMSRAALATLTRVTISNNTGADGGGGLHNEATISLSDSTLSGNSGTNGGGIYSSGSLTAVNVTISDNSGTVTGGGISNAGNASLTNVTLAQNNANFAGSLENLGTATLKNVILDRGQNGANCSGASTSLGHNLSDDDSCAGWMIGSGDINGSSALLLPLQDNGGPTLTHAPGEGSPAIDGGDDSGCPATDQRGATRPQGSACDIGAFEVGAAPPERRQGDLDCDSDIDGRDAVTGILFSAGLPLLSRPESCPALDSGAPQFGDVNCDGAVDALDALAVTAYFAGGPYQRSAQCTAIGQPL